MKKDLIAASIFLILLTTISKITGFIREIILAYFYGASAITDAYITATTIATIFIGGIINSIVLSYIPRATAARINNKNVSYITSNLITISSLLILIISVISMCFSREITWLFAMGFNEQTLTLAAGMTYLILPFCFIYAINNIATGYLQSINSFWFIGLNSILANIIIIISITISGHNTYILAFGLIGSWLIPTIWAYFLVQRKGLKYAYVFNVKDHTLKAIMVSSFPIFLGQLVIQLNTLVDRNFASTLGQGIISAMQYANKLNLLFITLFVGSIATTLFPKFSEQVASGNLHNLKNTASKSLNIILLLVMPVVTGIVILAHPLVEIVYMRGEFDQTAAIITANALAIYALGMPGLSFTEILNREFYALHDTRTPVICSVISIGVNIILNFILVHRWGYLGLAISTSMAATLLAGLLFILLRRRIGALGLSHLLGNFFKISIAITIMGIVIYNLNTWLVFIWGLNTIIRIMILVINVLVGSGIYFLFIYILKVTEVIEIGLLLKQKVGRFGS